MEEFVPPVKKPNVLYNNFFSFLQKKYFDGTQSEKNIYSFALRYKLLPQPFSENVLIPPKDRNLFIGYSSFIQDKFGISKPFEKDAYESLKAYGFTFEQILSYSFDEIMKSCKVSGTEQTKFKINELFSHFCFNIKKEAVQSGIASHKSIEIIDEFENQLINENEIDVEKVAEKIQKKTKKLIMFKNDKNKLEFLRVIKHPVMFSNALRVMSLNVIDFYNEQQRLKEIKDSKISHNIITEKER